MLMDKASTYNVDDMLDFMMGHIEIIENPLEKLNKLKKHTLI